MLRFKLSRATQITLLSVSALVGILLGRAEFSVGVDVLIGLALVAIVSIIARRFLLLALIVLICGFGVWRGNTTIFSKTPVGTQIGNKVTLTGTIADDPSRDARGRTVFVLGKTEMNGKVINQSVRITSPYKELKRGQKVQVTGKLQANLGSVRARMFSVVTVTDKRISDIEKLRQRFFAAMHSSLPDPLSGFGLGLLVGVRALIDKPLQETLTLVGLSHLVAVSGYNLTIIIRAINKVLRRISIFIATAVSLWLILGFMLVAGFSASIVRAAFVTTLALIAGYFGHRVKPMTLIAIPAGITALYNPSYLTNDLGWQLSFLAFFGILVLAPLIKSRLGMRGGLMSQVVIESLCAQLMTFPLIMVVFGNVSLISPLANALIVPLVPLAMLLSFATGIIGMVLPGVGAIVALPAAGLLGIMLATIDGLAHVKFAGIKLALDAVAGASIYLVLIVVTVITWKSASARSKSTVE